MTEHYSRSTNALAHITARFFAIFALFPFHVIADWQQIDQTESMVIYLDIDNITKISEDKRGVKNLIDFFIPQVAEPSGKQITFQSSCVRLK